MPEYTFHNLSPYDLEILVRDLLQAELSVRLESFARGRDKGIDLRYAKDRANAIVVQSKHYARSSWPALRKSLEAEVPKVRALSPKRYIVATSLPLTAERKEWVCKAFAPYCQTPADVFGVEDLNNLLGRHKEIERQHYKLWLTSVAVLERVLHSEIFAEQESEVNSLMKRVSRFVVNPSVGRARHILSEHHFCVITGVPGIGKTTLAEMLIIDHLDRGFECFRIWDDIGDARRVFMNGKPQLFYYDDFLGRTGLRQAEKNEDERLLRFIRDVVQSSHHRLLLTTRDYILNQARTVLEGLNTADIDPARCVVGLADYTPFIRAQILYNHLYYSGIPREHIEALVQSRAYRAIVHHANYSPRIVEAMTDVLNVRDLSAAAYPDAFLQNLANPKRLWETAYAGHLTHSAQNVLLVMVSLPNLVRLGEAEVAFEAFHRPRCERYGQTGSPYDWRRAIKELDGSFLTTAANLGTITLQLHNPSVRDFLENHVREQPRDTTELIAFAAFPDQLARMSGILAPLAERSWVVPSLRRFLEIFDNPSAKLYQLRLPDDHVEWRQATESPIVRFLAFSKLASLGDPTHVRKLVEEAATLALRYLEGTTPDRPELTRLLNQILTGSVPGIDQQHRLYSVAFSRAFGDLGSPDIGIDGYQALVDFAFEHVDAVADDIRERLVSQFDPFAAQELDVLDQDPDAASRLSAYDDLAAIAERLGRPLPRSREAMMESIEYWPDEDDDSRLGSTNDTVGGMSDGDLDSMFETLTD